MLTSLTWAAAVMMRVKDRRRRSSVSREMSRLRLSREQAWSPALVAVQVQVATPCRVVVPVRCSLLLAAQARQWVQ
jgi:hypothetical protein